MENEKTSNKILGQHVYPDGTRSRKKYIWHIPKYLRGTFEIGDVVMVDAKGHLSPVIVLDIFREESVVGGTKYKIVCRKAKGKKRE